MDPLSLSVPPLISIAITQIYSIIKDDFLSLYDLDKTVQNLQTKLKTIQGVLEDAEETPTLRNWLEDLLEAAHDAEDILETWETKHYQRKQQDSTVRNLLGARKAWSQYDIAQSIKETTTKLEMIVDHGKLFQLKAGRRMISPQESSSVAPSGVVGRDSVKENIIKLLVSDDKSFSLIPIIGMAGLGKTTLAQLVYNDERVKNRFKIRKWVCVTANFDLKKVLKDMIPDNEKKHGVNELSMDQLQLRLQEYLSGDRFLLVLDDVWNSNAQEWNQLKTLLEGKGSRVLVTGEDETIFKIMGSRSSKPFILQCLSHDESWELFKTKSKIGDRKDLKVHGMSIVQKCGGLPSAIVHMGSLLCGEAEEREWKRIAGSEIWELEKPEFNLETGNHTILSPLRLSYNRLSNPNLKQCLAYCSIFPKSYEFDMNELVEIWMAHKFIPQCDKDTGNKYFETLLRRFFFQQSTSNKKRYRMHVLIHDLATSISRSYCILEKDADTPTSHITEKTRHLSLSYAKQLDLDFIDRSKKLRTLMLRCRNPKEALHDNMLFKALNRMFRTLTYLRVLDLSSSTLSALPKSIELLTLLRYLNLSNTCIQNLPNSICSLYNLQTLKLLGCPLLLELPKDFGNLINLRHIELDEVFWYELSRSPLTMASLKGHNLHLFGVGDEGNNGDKFGYEIEVLRNVRDTVLSISEHENAKNARKMGKKEMKALEDLHRDFKIKEHQENVMVNPPYWITNKLLQNLISLRFSHWMKCKIFCLGELCYLQELNIKEMPNLEELSAAKQFQGLITLNISKCPKLCKLPTEFPKLSDLKIKECVSLKAVPIALRLRSLKLVECPKLSEFPTTFPALKVLKIKSCLSLETLPTAPKLQYLTLVDNPSLQQWNELGQRIRSENPSLFCILNVKIIKCPRLQALPQNFNPRKLEISRCESLSALPDLEQPCNLKHLTLEACDPTLVKSIPGTRNLLCLDISNISNLNSFPKCSNLPRLKKLYIRDCKDLVSLSEQEEDESLLLGLTALKLLSIHNCPKLVKLPDIGLPNTLECLSITSCPSLESFGPEDVFKRLTNLDVLYIVDCHAVLSLPEEGLSSSLRHLCIQGCPTLMERCQKEDGDLPKIMNIPMLEIKKATSTPLAAPWNHHFIGGTGQSLNGKMERAETSSSSEYGQNLKWKEEESSSSDEFEQTLEGKMVLRESSRSAERRQGLEGKKALGESSSSTEYGQDLEGKMVLGKSSSSTEHRQISEGNLVIAKPSSSPEQIRRGWQREEVASSFEGYISMGPWGGTGGSRWSTYITQGGIKEVVVHSRVAIDSIIFKSVDGNGVMEDSYKVGGDGGGEGEPLFIDWPREYLTGISGTYKTVAGYSGPFGSITAITSLCFHTNRPNCKYGPFGADNSGIPFSNIMKGAVIVGFHGQSGLLLDSIGLYVKPITSC